MPFASIAISYNMCGSYLFSFAHTKSASAHRKGTGFGCSIWSLHCFNTNTHGKFSLIPFSLAISFSIILSLSLSLSSARSFRFSFLHRYGILYGSRANFPTCIVCMNAIFNVCLQWKICNQIICEVLECVCVCVRACFSSFCVFAFAKIPNKTDKQNNKKKTGAALIQRQK